MSGNDGDGSEVDLGLDWFEDWADQYTQRFATSRFFPGVIDEVRETLERLVSGEFHPAEVSGEFFPPDGATTAGPVPDSDSSSEGFSDDGSWRCLHCHRRAEHPERQEDGTYPCAECGVDARIHPDDPTTVALFPTREQVRAATVEFRRSVRNGWRVPTPGTSDGEEAESSSDEEARQSRDLRRRIDLQRRCNGGPGFRPVDYPSSSDDEN